MKRFIVTRHYVKFKGKLYRKGELLPENFTERDRCRNIYPSRIGTTEVPDEAPAAATATVVTGQTATVPPVTPVASQVVTPVATTQGVTNAAKPLSSPTTPTGTVPVRALSSN